MAFEGQIKAKIQAFGSRTGKSTPACAATGGRQRLRRRGASTLPVKQNDAPRQQQAEAPLYTYDDERQQEEWSVATQRSAESLPTWGRLNTQERRAEAVTVDPPSTSQRQPDRRPTERVWKRQEERGDAEINSERWEQNSRPRSFSRPTANRQQAILGGREASGRYSSTRPQETDASDEWWDEREEAGDRQRPRQVSDVSQRRQHLTHKERVAIMLDSNAAISRAAENFEQQVEQHEKGSPGLQRALQDFLADLGDVVGRNGSYFDEINLATAFRQLAAAADAVRPSAAVKPEAAELLDRLIALSLDRISGFRIGAVVQTVSALVKLAALGSASPMPSRESEQGDSLHLLLEGLAGRALRRFREPPAADPRELALTIWGYSRLGIDPLEGNLFTAIVRAIEPQLAQTEFQNLSNLMIAAATLNRKLPEGFMTAVAEQAILKMPKATSQGTANMLWAFAKLDAETLLKGDLFRSGISHALEISEELEALNTANILWAAVTVEHPVSEATLDTLAASAVKHMKSASPATTAALLWAVRKLEVNPLGGRLILAALEQADRHLEHCNRHAISNILWGVSGEGVEIPKKLLQRLEGPWAERALALISEVEGGERWAQNLALILLAYARLRLDPLQGRLFKEALELLANRVDILNAQNASNILMAAAVLQRKAFPQGVVAQAVEKVAKEGNAQEVCNVAWSLTVLGALSQSAMVSLMRRLQVVGGGQQMPPTHANQLLMADLALRLLSKEASESALPEEIAEAAKDCCRDNKVLTFSQFHEEVSSTLEGMGIPHAIEFASPDGLLSIDIVARCGDGKPLAIEVDGPLHFTALPPYRPLGSTILRNQLIAASGFRGLGIPQYDWQRLRSAQQRTDYLTARLSKWGIAPVEVTAAATTQ